MTTDGAPIIACTPRYLPRAQWLEAAQAAARSRADNIEPGTNLPAEPPKEGGKMALDIRKYWGEAGVKLTVSFLDDPPKDLRNRIIEHMNAWNKTANVEFMFTQGTGHVRIARVKGDGYWSFLGTDIGFIPQDRPTMNLDSFTMNTPESEFVRVVRHETGHTLGFPHEHMRRALVDRLDRKKVIAEFMRTQGWTEQEVINQVLTPIEESQLIATESDPNSIMCYQIDAKLTLDGIAIPGGRDIDASDFRLAGQVYPKP